MANVKSLTMVNTVIVNSFGYGMFGINAVGSLTSVSFIRNNYYAYYYEPRCYCTRHSDLHCCGGNALFLFQDFASESQCPEGTNLLDIKNTSFHYGVNLCNSDKFQSYLYHDAWVDEKYRHSIYSPYTLAQPFIFPYTLGCMVARTTNALAVANGHQTVWETLAN